MMKRTLSIGYSPCPNDTFIFYALTHGRIPLHHVRLERPLLEDVETLNSWALAGKLDCTKLSFHALGHVRDHYTMLGSGAALGRGCGPLLVTRPDRQSGDPCGWKIAVPGTYTTAALLLKLCFPAHCRAVVMRFDTIMDAVAAGRVDGGVIIHESRFTFQEHGLVCVQDLGQWWETETGLPLPLGCIAVRTSFESQEINEIEKAIHDSIQWAFTHPQQCSNYIKQYARELDDQVIAGHIGLYVNDFSLQLGEEGRAAGRELFRRGRAAGVFPAAPGEAE